MEHQANILRSIDFIKQHLKSNLTAQQIADYVGYSTSHFCRIFSHYQKTPLMDYVRMMRLVAARQDLLHREKIIDVALDYGFQTASGFSKAFRKTFGYSPSIYLKRYTALESEDYCDFVRFNPEEVKTNFCYKPSFRVAGFGIETASSRASTKDIAAYWETYNGENLEQKMYDLLEPPKHGEVGICITTPESKTVTYLFGVIVPDYSKITKEMMTCIIPSAEYVIFTTPSIDNTETATSYQEDPLAEMVKETWRYISLEWFPKSGYLFDENKLDFEFYDERCHGSAQLVMDIYIPIKKA